MELALLGVGLVEPELVAVALALELALQGFRKQRPLFVTRLLLNYIAS